MSIIPAPTPQPAEDSCQVLHFRLPFSGALNGVGPLRKFGSVNSRTSTNLLCYLECADSNQLKALWDDHTEVGLTFFGDLHANQCCLR